MKKYISPELEIVKYEASDCLTSSVTTKNGEYNIEFDLGNGWDDNII